jgi:hypothetical protein
MITIIGVIHPQMRLGSIDQHVAAANLFLT